MFHAGAVVDEGLVFVAPCLMSQIGIGGYLCRLNRTWRAYLLSCGKLRALFSWRMPKRVDALNPD